jgi:membrane protease YdiL (CAAX protease family)
LSKVPRQTEAEVSPPPAPTSDGEETLAAGQAAAGPASVDRWPSVTRSLLVALATTVVVTLASHLAPEEHANTAVGVTFLVATWWIALRGDVVSVRAYGLALGGLTEPVALSARRLAGDGLRAFGWALLMAAIFFPPFWIGFKLWWNVSQPFALAFPSDFHNRVLGQLLVIALPEEAFFRGVLQSGLDGRWARRRRRILGAELGPGWLLAAAIFAAGHLLTIPHPSRLGVFFPALLFGWMRARTGGIGASVVFHVMCNLFSTLLAEGYGLH